MKITGLDSSGANPPMQRSSEHSDVSWHMAWRRELERAQWEGRLRYQAKQEVQHEGSNQADSPLPGQAQRQSIETLPHVPDSGAQSRDGKAGVQVTSTQFAPRAAAQTIQQLRSPSPSTGAGQGVVQAGVVRDALAQRPMPSVPLSPALPMGEWAEWLPKVVHMSIQGDQVRASVRDSELNEAQAAKLFYRMRAQLQAWGLELAELIVNGHPVVEQLIDGEANHGAV